MSEYSDYVILIDENGQPYIAHSIFSNARQKGAKYIQKIKDGAKTRYFYTKAELEAYYNKGKQATKEAASKAKAYAKDKLGYDEKERLDRAKTRYERAQRNARAGAKNLASVVSRGLKSHDWLSDIPGIDDAIKRRNKGYREETEFREKYVNAQQDYDKTPLGRLDQLKEAAKDAYDDVDLALWKTGKKIRELADTANDWLYDKYLDVDIASDHFKAAVKDGAKEIKQFAEDKISDLDNLLNPEPPKPKLSSPNGKVETENIIEETIIPENTINEEIIPEKLVKEVSSNNRKYKPKVIKGQAPKEYVEELATNSGIDLHPLYSHQDKMATIQRQIREAGNAAYPSEEAYQRKLSVLQKEYEKEKAAYDEEYDSIIDAINARYRHD